RDPVSITVEHLRLKLEPDPRRVIMRFFGTGDVNRTRRVIERVLTYPESDVERLLDGLAADFQPKHPRLLEVFEEHYLLVRGHLPESREPSRARQLLLGACFTMEYALESVALFNPSIAPALNQEGVPPGSIRFVMSLRATGEGHVSSIVFRVRIIDERGKSQLEPPGTQSRSLNASVPDHFEKSLFQRDLATLGVPPEQAGRILDRLGPRFTRADLARAIDEARGDEGNSGFLEEAGDSLIAATQ